MKPDWDDTSPLLGDNLVRVLGLAKKHANARKGVSVALMRDWHGRIMAGLEMKEPGWAACYRGEGAAKHIGVSIGGHYGVAPDQVAAQLGTFETRLVRRRGARRSDR
jgi:hypothetical protein